MTTEEQLALRWRKGRPGELRPPAGDADLSLLEDALKGLAREESSVIPALQRVQDAYGYLPESVLARIADELGVPWARVYGVATFYAQFHLQPLGKLIIRVCRGTACHVAGVSGIIDAIQRTLGIGDNETTDDGLFTLQTVACLGTCSLAPVMLVGETYHGRLTAAQIPAILDHYRDKEAA